MNKKNIGIIAAIFVAMLLTSAPFALAAPSSKLTGFQTLDKDVLSLGESAGILPDSPIYGIKRFWEGMQVTFAGGDVAKAKLKYRFAEKRLAEAAEMLKSGKSQHLENAMKQYEGLMQEANDDTEKATAAGKKIDEIVGLAGNKTSKHLAVLNRLLDKVPETARPAIENAIQASANENYKIVIRDAKKGKKIISTLRSKLKDEGLREDLIVKAKQRLNISDTIKVTIGETESKVAADVADINKRFTLDLIDQTAIVSEIASRLNITSELVNGLVEWKYAKTSEETKDNLEEARDDVAALEQKISEMNSKATAAKKKVTAAFKKSIGKSVDVAKDHIAKGERYLLDKKYDSAWSQANSASKGADAADKRVDKYLAKLLKDLSTEEEEQDEETTTTTAPASTTTTVAASTTTTA
ncbi:MAG TPA: DUF5667 domain-containing protein [archaeon]|nr:DUF5667 domain-containing protein [archaeon]